MKETAKPSPLDRRNAALREALRAGDPAADLAPRDVERLRREMRTALVESAERRTLRLWLPIAAVAAALAVLWVVAAPLRQPPPRLEPVRGEVSEATHETVASAGEVRQMQFETPGGTRIIWVMPASLN